MKSPLKIAATLPRATLALRILLALAFLAAGGANLAAVPEMVALFNRIGLGQGFRLLTGVVEVIGAIALLLRPTALWGAAMLGCTMAVAVGVHGLRIGGSALPALLLLLLCALAAWLVRRAAPCAPRPSSAAGRC